MYTSLDWHLVAVIGISACFVLLWLLSVKACGEKTIALFEKTMALYFKNVSFLPTFLKVNHYSDIMWIGGSCVVEPLLSPFQWCQISDYLGGTHFLSIRTRPRSTHWEQQTFSIVGIFLMSSSCGKLDVKMFPHCSSKPLKQGPVFSYPSRG